VLGKKYWNVTYAASEIADGISTGGNIFVVINKTDDITEVKLESGLLQRPGHLYSLKRRFCSAKTGFGVRDIVNEIIKYVRVDYMFEKLKAERMKELTKNGVPSVSQEQKDALKQWVKETF
jgi:50S ribosomal subunit-associated GTPase HflX